MPQDNKIQNRFDSETPLWSAYHLGEVKTTVEREVIQRKEVAKKIIKQHYLQKNAEILEVGCGTGDNIAEILKLDKKWRGRGIDISTEMIEKAKEQYAYDRLSFSVMDIEKEAPAEQYDVILLLGVVGYLQNNKQAFENIFKALKPGGLLLFTYGNKKSVFRKVRNLRSRQKKSHFKSYYPKQIISWLPADAKVIQEHGLIYSTGFFGRFSVWVSKILEKIIKKDRLDQALTKFIVVKR